MHSLKLFFHAKVLVPIKHWIVRYEASLGVSQRGRSV